MHQYLDEYDGKVKSIHAARKKYSNLSLPDGRDYPELGFRLIHPTEQPEALPNHYVAADNPVLIDGKYYEAWRQVELTPPEPSYPQFTALEVLDLFTEDEQLAVVEATMSNPAVKLWYDRLIAASYVTYEDPRTEAGLQALVDVGLLTSQRKAEIVDAMQPQ